MTWNKKDVLIAEISGKRAGGVKQRPTESFDYDFDKVIISNNSDGYETDWNIVNVPEDYVNWYKTNVKSSESAWYAPMNRSYAIKYVKNTDISTLSNQTIISYFGKWLTS